MDDRGRTAHNRPHHLYLLSPTAPTLYVLLALADQERHGYGIMQEVAAFTDGEIRLGPGTLYGAIKRMLETGLIESAKAPTMTSTRTRVAVTTGSPGLGGRHWRRS